MKHVVLDDAGEVIARTDTHAEGIRVLVAKGILATGRCLSLFAYYEMLAENPPNNLGIPADLPNDDDDPTEEITVKVRLPGEDHDEIDPGEPEWSPWDDDRPLTDTSYSNGWRYLAACRYPFRCTDCDTEYPADSRLIYLKGRARLCGSCAIQRGYVQTVQTIPVQTVPVQTVPVQTVPVQTVPVQTVPVTAPVVVLAHEEAVQRAEEDTDRLAQAGFAPAETIVPFGTALIGTGRDRFEQLKAAALAGPSLADSLREIGPIVESERRDTIERVPMDRTSLDVVDGALILRGPGIPRDLRINRKIGHKLSLDTWGSVLFPVTHQERCTAEEIADHYNRRANRVLEGRYADLGIRTITGHLQAYRLTTDSYTEHDVGRVAEEIAEAIDSAGYDYRGPAAYDPDTSTLRADGWIFAGHVSQVVAGSTYAVGIWLRTGDDGATGISGGPGYLRALCVNLTTETGKKRSFSVSHRGARDDIVRKIATGMRASARSWKWYLDRIGVMARTPIEVAHKIPDTVHTDRDRVAAVMAEIASDVRPTGVKRDAIVEALLGAWDQEPGGDLAAIERAISALRHRVPVFAQAEIADAAGRYVATVAPLAERYVRSL